MAYSGRADPSCPPQTKLQASPHVLAGYRPVSPGRTSPPRAIAVAVAGVLLLQIALSWGRMGLPFLDGRLHFNYDNALFSVLARTGILLGDARSQMGVTQIHYDSWGQPAGAPTYYTHHPFLFKAVFQLWVRLFGDSEFSSRAFALTVSMAATSGAVVALAIATGSALAAFLGTAVMVATPVFATFQLCIKYELDGMAIGTWLFAMRFLYMKRPSRWILALVFLLAVLAPLAHWTAVILVVSLIGWLAGERVFRQARDTEMPLLALTVGAGIGGMVLLAAFIWLKGGWAPYWHDQVAVFRLHHDLSALRPGEWGEQQRNFIALNYTPVLLWAVGLLAGAHGLAWVRRRASNTPMGNADSGRMLAAYFFCALAPALIWVFAFPHASFFHYYMQIWLVLPLGVLITATIGPARGRALRTVGAVAATGVLIAWLFVSSTALTHSVIDAQIGTTDDIAFLRSLRTDRFDRFVFIPTKEDRRNSWFAGPIFEYYTARSVVQFNPSVILGPRDKILLLPYNGRARTLARIDSLLGVRLVNEKCGTALCAYDVSRP